jgi:hypothetical protein
MSKEPTPKQCPFCGLLPVLLPVATDEDAMARGLRDWTVPENPRAIYHASGRSRCPASGFHLLPRWNKRSRKT